MKLSRLHRLIAVCCGIALTGGGISLLARAGIIPVWAFWVCMVPLGLALMQAGADASDALDDEEDNKR